MKIDKAISASMAMDETTWDRHANPWSVYTRVPLMMVLAFAIWSRVWIGWWALLPVGLAIVWTFLNPRAFPPPASIDNWASKVTLGERLWLNRRARPIPRHHASWALGLSTASAVALLPMVYGLAVLEPFSAFLGALLASVLKLWFCDRMVWLYDDMQRDETAADSAPSTPEHRIP
ncbi:MAG: hypothetical protein CL535_04855 [Ahrensia sp.]|nr:hypothetical protein [Ahrensia sp.]